MSSADQAALEARIAGLPLYPYQVTGVRWLASRRDALLADEMGLGKTLQALAAAPADAAILVVCPAAVKGTWSAEVARWRPDLTATILRGRGSFRWPEAGEVVILNYELLPAVVPGHCPAGIILVADEAHYVKTAKSARTKRLAAVGREVHARGGCRWALTATPLMNRPPELRTVLLLFGLARGAGIEKWHYLLAAFRGRKGRWGYRWGLPVPGFVRNLKEVMLRRRLSVVLPDLPPLRHQAHIVNGLDRTTTALLASVMRDLEKAGITLETLLEAGETADSATVETRYGTSMIFERIAEARAALAMAKIPAALELVQQFEDAEEPLVVFSAHRAGIDAIGQRDGWSTITGDVSAEERTRRIAAFQAGELKGLACTIQAGGIGITLTHASHAMFIDLAWTPAANVQAEARLRRIGQEASAVVIHRLQVDHPLDERVNELLAAKARLLDATITAAEVSA